MCEAMANHPVYSGQLKSGAPNLHNLVFHHYGKAGAAQAWG